jgi:hypothetical protein
MCGMRSSIVHRQSTAWCQNGGARAGAEASASGITATSLGTVSNPIQTVTLALVAATSDPAPLIRRIALCTLANYQPIYSTDAATVLAEAVPLLDSEIEYTADANDVGTYQAMRQLRQAISDDLRTRGSNLPALITVTVPNMLPSCRLAQLLRQDGTRSNELIQRNDWQHAMLHNSLIQALSL